MLHQRSFGQLHNNVLLTINILHEMATNVKIFEENSNTNVYIHSMALFCDILYNMD